MFSPITKICLYFFLIPMVFLKKELFMNFGQKMIINCQEHRNLTEEEWRFVFSDESRFGMRSDIRHGIGGHRNAWTSRTFTIMPRRPCIQW